MTTAPKTIKVFTDEQAHKAIVANPSKVLSLTVKKDNKTGKPKEYQGTIFMNAGYDVFGEKNDGWFTITQDIPLSRGVADPNNKQDARNKYAGTRNQLEMKRSAAGHIGQFFDLLDPVFKAEIDRLANAKELIKGSRKFHDLLQYRLSEENPENPGAPIEDPILRFQVETGTFPKEYPYAFLRGQPKTAFLDYRTRYMDDNKKEQFKLASFKDETGKDVLVTAENMHKFITNGAVLKAGSRIMVPSAARSQSWISLPIIINKAIIEQRAEVEGFSDETPVDMSALKAALPATQPVATVEAPVAQAVTTEAVTVAPTTVEPTADDKQVDEISNVLDAI